jgi:hypothetical protein
MILVLGNPAEQADDGGTFLRRSHVLPRRRAWVRTSLARVSRWLVLWKTS